MNFLKNRHTVSHFTFPPATHKGANVFTSSPALVIFPFSSVAHLGGEVAPHCGPSSSSKDVSELQLLSSQKPVSFHGLVSTHAPARSPALRRPPVLSASTCSSPVLALLSGVCCPSGKLWEDVRLQETGQEAAEEEKWRENGSLGKGNPGEDQQPFTVSLAYAFESKSHLCLVMSLINGGALRFHIYSVGTRGPATSRVVFYAAPALSRHRLPGPEA